MFRHELLEPKKLPRETIEGRRYYVTPSGMHLPSVTTVLKDYYKKDFTAWRKRIGEVEANAITHQAAARGTSLHSLCEKYMRNDADYLKNVRPAAYADFLSVQSLLDMNVSVVMGVEFPLFSERLRTAGTADLICTWGNQPSVVDFKTSKRPKKEEWIEDYFVQAAVYGQMVKETYGIDTTQIIILLLIENDIPVIFQKDIEIYKEKVDEIFISSRHDAPINGSARANV